MSRIVPTDKPLSDEDRAYLQMRGEDARIKWFDDTYPSEEEEADADAEEEETELDDEEDLDDEDEEDDDEPPAYDEWTIAELKGEIERRNKANGPDAQMSVTGVKADLAARLRDNDAA